MSHSDVETTVQAAALAEKKAYYSPVLRRHGSIRDVTLTNADGPNFDGGGGANIYVS